MRKNRPNITSLCFLTIAVLLVSCDPEKKCSCNCDCDSCSCKSSSGIEYLKTPRFISFDNDVVLWTYVDNASGYVFKIKNLEYKVAFNYIDISFINLDSGDYSVSIKAISDSVFFIDSCYCEPFIITIM